MADAPTVSEALGAIANALTGERVSTGNEPTRSNKAVTVFDEGSIGEIFGEIFKPGTPEYNRLVQKARATKFATGDLPRDIRNYLKLKGNAKILSELLGD